MDNDKDQFEAGEDVTEEVVREKPKGIVVSVRLPFPEADQLVSLAEMSGKTISQMAREAIRSFISRGGLPASLAVEIQGISTDNLTIFTSASGPRTLGPEAQAKNRVEPTPEHALTLLAGKP